jgi:hypothetical protein
MKKKYRNKLPKDAKVKGFNAHVDNGELIVDVEFKDKFLPKDGDFLIDADGDIFICSNAYTQNSNFYSCYYGNFYSCYCGTHHGKIRAAFCYNWVDKEGCRFATLEEKADFLKRLETEEHLRWNADTKVLEPIRWRAEFGENYFIVTNSKERNSFIVKEKRECSSIFDEENYQLNNYFRTPEAAQKVAGQIINIFKNAKAE